MDTEPQLPELNRRTFRRLARTQALQLLLMIGGIGALLMGLSILAIILQAQQIELRSADRMIVVSSADPDPALLSLIVAQQRRNFTPQIIIIGPAPERMAEQLRDAGIQADDLIVAEATSIVQQLRTHHTAASTLILAEPEELMLLRKISRDLGQMTFIGAPPDRPLRSIPTLRAAWAYWQYALFGQR